MTDKFPEAFGRFEERVKFKNLKTFPQLLRAFQGWGGRGSPLTRNQIKGLAIEAKKRRIINVRVREKYRRANGRYQIVYRDPLTGRFTRATC